MEKLCLYIIVPYDIIIKGQKEILDLKSVNIIGLVTGWFEITQYDDKIAISISNLVKTTWLTRYPRPMEITHGQGSKFIGHEFIK